MLRPSGPEKNSGKMVTTLMRSATLVLADREVVHETELLVDHERSFVEIHANDYFRSIRHQYTPAGSLDIQYEPLREFIESGHFTQLLAAGAGDAHSFQIVQIDLVLVQRRELAKWR